MNPPIFHSFLYVYQRVYPINIPLNPIKPPFSYGFPMVFMLNHPNCRGTPIFEAKTQKISVPKADFLLLNAGGIIDVEKGCE